LLFKSAFGVLKVSCIYIVSVFFGAIWLFWGLLWPFCLWLPGNPSAETWRKKLTRLLTLDNFYFCCFQLYRCENRSWCNALKPLLHWKQLL